MRINSVNSNNTSCYVGKQIPSFKSVGFYVTPALKCGIPENLRPIFIAIRNDKEADFVFKWPCDGILPLGLSDKAKKLSEMSEKFSDNEIAQQVRQILKQLRQDNNVFWNRLDEPRLKEIDSTIDEGTFIVGEKELILAKDPEALDFLSKR